MNIIIDIEANGLENPTEVWVVVCKDIDTGEYQVFRELTRNPLEKERFLRYAKQVDIWIGHNWLGYDYPVLNRLCNLNIPSVASCSLDTLILSKLIDYSRKGHSVEDYGMEFNLEKGVFNDWSSYSKRMEEYCIRDVDICERIYRKYIKYINNPEHSAAIRLEHEFQLVANDLHDIGFAFNRERGRRLLERVTRDLALIDTEIKEAFPAQQKLVKTFTPK